jgi:hypothetical protein
MIFLILRKLSRNILSKHEIKRLSLSSTRKHRKRSVGAGRHFKLVVKDSVIMVLVYYRLYITYTLMEFLFGLDGWTRVMYAGRHIQKIEPLIRKCLLAYSPKTVLCN